jgi:regulator of protease activity HflC (stomatin/prohibitin superfamily)
MAKVVVQAQERVLVYRDGVFEQQLEPGRHSVRRPWRVRREAVDLRVRQLTVSGQEVFTSDGVTVRVTAVARWQVSEPRAFVEYAEAPLDLLSSRSSSPSARRSADGSSTSCFGPRRGPR